MQKVAVMQKATLVFISTLFIASCAVTHRANVPMTPSPKSSREIAACLRNPNCHKFFPTAHRGLGFGAPENSREAVRRAVAANIPMVEIDVRLSRDKKLFVLHDASLDRTTSWHGKISEYTSDELKFIFLENGESAPPFEEIYCITRGRSMLILDIKGGIVEEMAEWIAQNGSFDDVIFCINGEDEFQKAARMKAKYPVMIISAEVYSKNNLETLQSYFPNALPEILDIGYPFGNKFSWLPQDCKINATYLVWEIGLPFLKPILPYCPQLQKIDILMTNDPMFWMKKAP